MLMFIKTFFLDVKIKSGETGGEVIRLLLQSLITLFLWKTCP